MPADVTMTSSEPSTIAGPDAPPANGDAISRTANVTEAKADDVISDPDDVNSATDELADAALAAGERKRRSPFGLLRERNFRQLFLADTGSQLGTQISNLALPLAAAITLHATPFQLGVITAADSLPYLLCSLPAGALADRVRRRRMMIACDLARLVTLASVPLAWWGHWLTIGQLIVVAFLLGTFTATFEVAYQSFLPEIVRPGDLVEGNAKLQGIAAVTQIGGPAAAGGIIGVLTAPYAIALDALSYLGSALFLGRIRLPEPKPVRDPDRRLGRDIVEGLRFVRRSPELRAIAATASMSNFFNSMQSTMLVFLLARVLHAGAATIGALLSIAYVGGLVGALTATKLADRVGQGRVIWLSILVSGPFGFFMPVLQRGTLMWISAAAFTVLVAGGVVFSITSISSRQRMSPPHLLGRVNATMRFLILGTMPLGGLLGGLLGTLIGVRPTLWIAATGCLLSFLPAFLSPLRDMRELPVHAAASAA